MWHKIHTWVIMCILGYRHKFLRFKLTYNYNQNSPIQNHIYLLFNNVFCVSGAGHIVNSLLQSFIFYDTW